MNSFTADTDAVPVRSAAEPRHRLGKTGLTDRDDLPAHAHDDESVYRYVEFLREVFYEVVRMYGNPTNAIVMHAASLPVIRGERPINMHSIAAITGLHKNTVRDAVNRMIRGGMVTRRTDGGIVPRALPDDAVPTADRLMRRMRATADRFRPRPPARSAEEAG